MIEINETKFINPDTGCEELHYETKIDCDDGMEGVLRHFAILTAKIRDMFFVTDASGTITQADVDNHLFTAFRVGMEQVAYGADVQNVFAQRMASGGSSDPTDPTDS